MNIWSILSLIFAVVATGSCLLAFRLFQTHQDLRQKLDDAQRLNLDQSSKLAQMTERLRALDEAKTLMADQFKLASQAAMEETLKRTELSLKAREDLAQERMLNSLKPVAETLTRFEAQMKTLEETRLKDAGGLKQEIAHLMQASEATRETTQKLANSLKRGAGVQGRWGEETLRNVLEAAGLTRFDFTEQQSTDTEEGRRRPDVVVKLPGGVFVIDSKVNLSAFLEAMEATDDQARDMHLMRHAKALQAHVRDLSLKAYWDQFEQSPDFVALFIPGDGFLAAALERLPQLMHEAMDRKVIIVTPTTLFALCKAVAYGWRIEDQMKNAHAVADLGRELYGRLSTMGGHVAAMGRSLGTAVDKYNDFIGSLETKVLSQARKFEALSVHHQGKPIAELDSLDKAPKTLSRLEITEKSDSSE